MMELTETQSLEQEDALRTVFFALAQSIRDEGRQVDRIEIRHATPLTWPCRVFYSGDDDFEGVFVSIEE